MTSEVYVNLLTGGRGAERGQPYYPTAGGTRMSSRKDRTDD